MRKVLFFIILMLLLPFTLQAAELPFVRVLGELQNFFTGPFARGIAILGFVGAGLTLLFAGQELSSFVKTLLYVLLVVTLIINVSGIIDAFFPSKTTTTTTTK